ncbi:unnamed protein product [Lymnaea stagnalis]|uniref:H-type lectin domain-containing protein n=1 Tax=Lymnaea stagnalis TaxID=6523 RepID=A0AAV2I1Y3_LYMST
MVKSNKMSFGLICIFVMVFVIEASDILLTAEPASIKDGLTKTLQMKCSLQHAHQGEDAAHSRAGLSKMTVNSISVTRDDKTTIASISSRQPAVASADMDTLTVCGNLTPGVDSSYLQLTWAKPGIHQAGIYTCTINATDNAGLDFLYKSNTYICHQRPNEEDIIQYIIELEDRLSQTETEVQECGKSLKTELTAIRLSLNNSQSYLQGQIDILKAQDAATAEALKRLETGASALRTDLTAIQNSLDSYVAEEGLVNFGSSPSFQPAGEYNLRSRVVYVKFTKTFSKLPTVVCNLQAMDADKGTNTRFRYYIRDLTTAGFNLHCETWWDTLLHGIDIKWRASIP